MARASAATSRIPGRHAIALVVLLVIVGCGGRSSAPTSSAPGSAPAATSSSVAPVPTTAAAPARYANQILGYVGVEKGGDAYLQLAFVDINVADPTQFDRIDDLVLVTDTGEVPATVASLSPSPIGPGVRLLTLEAKLKGVAAPMTVKAMRYRDGTGTSRQLSVGAIRVDPRTTPTSPLDISRYSVGQSAMGFIEVAFSNTSRDNVTLQKLEFDIPGLPVASSVGVVADEGSPAASGAPAPQETTSGGSAVIEPGATRTVQFSLAPAEPEISRFVELAPFATYATSSGTAGSLLLPLQVYFPAFAGPDDLDAYLAILPPSAVVAFQGSRP